VGDHANTKEESRYLTSFVHQEKRKPASTKPFEMKRTRRDRKEMENILFKLFERQPNWSLKQLMQETDQPEVHFSLLYPTQRRHWFPTTITALFTLRNHLQIACTSFALCSNS
jgi:hypothetical protein